MTRVGPAVAFSTVGSAVESGAELTYSIGNVAGSAVRSPRPNAIVGAGELSGDDNSSSAVPSSDGAGVCKAGRIGAADGARSSIIVDGSVGSRDGNADGTNDSCSVLKRPCAGGAVAVAGT